MKLKISLKIDLKINSPSSGTVISDELEVAELFKSTFENKVVELKKVSSANLAPLLCKLRENRNSRVLHWDVGLIAVSDTLKAIDSLKPSLSCGPDGIPNKLVKMFKYQICQSFTTLANDSINTGVFQESGSKGR